MTSISYRAGQQDARQLKHVGLVAAADGSADLGANRRGTGLMVTDEDGHINLDFSSPVGGPVTSLRSEAAGVFSILQKVVEECSNLNPCIQVCLLNRTQVFHL